MRLYKLSQKKAELLMELGPLRILLLNGFLMLKSN